MTDEDRERRRQERAPDRGARDPEDPEEGPGPHENTDEVTLADSGLTGAEGPRRAPGDGAERDEVGPRDAERQDAERHRRATTEDDEGG